MSGLILCRACSAVLQRLQAEGQLPGSAAEVQRTLSVPVPDISPALKAMVGYGRALSLGMAFEAQLVAADDPTVRAVLQNTGPAHVCRRMFGGIVFNKTRLSSSAEGECGKMMVRALVALFLDGTALRPNPV